MQTNIILNAYRRWHWEWFIKYMISWFVFCSGSKSIGSLDPENVAQLWSTTIGMAPTLWIYIRSNKFFVMQLAIAKWQHSCKEIYTCITLSKICVVFHRFSKAELQFLALLPKLRRNVRVIAECGNW